MIFYHTFLESLNRDFEAVRQAKSSARGSVTILRHKQSGGRYVFRQFEGSGEVYRKLLPLNCPHLPQILEVAEQDGKVAVLEEYIQGDTLDFLLEGSLLSVKKAKEIMRQLCTALWVLHTQGAVHRDIKPENVILRGNEVVLIDFDASRLVKDECSSDTVVLGTVGFAAPEQFGLSQSDSRADIYSMGVLLNIMVTGKHPSKELAKGRIGTIVQRCTMMNPEKRYPSVLHLMEAL